MGLCGANSLRISLKWLKNHNNKKKKSKGSLHLTTQITFTCIGVDRTNDGVKFCILSQSIPWCFSGPSLLQTVQLVLPTKANVKGRLVTNAVRFGFAGRSQIYWAPVRRTEAKGGDGLSEQWSVSRLWQLQTYDQQLMLVLVSRRTAQIHVYVWSGTVKVMTFTSKK